MEGLKLYKHIIWDFDGTLFDTYQVMGTAFKMTLEEDKIEESIDEILKHMKVSISGAMQHYKEKYQIDNTFLERYKKRRKEMELELCKPFEGAEDICRYIYAAGKNNYIYTHRGESTLKFLEVNNLHDYFTDCITSGHGFERKPSPDAINYLIDKYNINCDEAIMIGDRDVDILSAKNAGIFACFFHDGDENSKIADFTINSFEQLYEIIN